MKPIMSFWSEPYIRSTNNHWMNPNSWNLSWILSVEAVTKSYGKPHLYTDDIGKHFLVDQLQLDFASVSVELNELRGRNPKFFSIGRNYVIGLQKEPFIHVDYDAYLLDPVFPELFDNGVLFEKEKLYSIDSKTFLKPDSISNFYSIPDWWNDGIVDSKYKSYGYGVVGGSNLEYFSKLSQSVFDIINSNSDEKWEQLNIFLKNKADIQSLKFFAPQYLVEEYAAYSLAKKMGFSPKFIVDNKGNTSSKFGHSSLDKTKYSELYGRFLKRIISDYPHRKSLIEKLEPSRNLSLPRVSVVIIPNNYSSVYDAVLRALIPRKTTPDEIFVSSFNLKEEDKNLLSKIEGVRVVPEGKDYLDSIGVAFRRTTGNLIIVIDGHIKVPSMYIERSVAGYLEHENTVFCTASNEFSDKENYTCYGALEDDKGIHPNFVEKKEEVFDTPEVSCLYGGIYVFTNKALNEIFLPSSDLNKFSRVSSFLENKGFKIRCIKNILASNCFKKSSENIIE